jgi:periplasmic protein TonB
MAYFQYQQDQNDARFRRIVFRCIVFYFSFAALITLIPFPHPERPDFKNLPNRVARLILKNPLPIPPPVVPEAAKPREEAAGAKPKGEKAAAQPAQKTAAQRREIVMKSGLLGSLNSGEAGKRLNTIIRDQKIDRALAAADLITGPTSKKGRPVIKNTLPAKSDLADRKMAQAGRLKEGERVVLTKGEEVSLTPLRGSSADGGSGGHGDGPGNGMGIRLKGGGSGSGGGSINYDLIARVVEQYKGGLVYLYNKALRTNPTLKGTITVEFTIGANGKVMEARVVTSTMDYTPLEGALAGRIRMWKFPHLYDGVIVVTYPFVFFPV